MIKLREAQVTDLYDLLRLFSVMYGKEVEQTDERTIKIWNRMITDPFYHIIVAEEDGKNFLYVHWIDVTAESGEQAGEAIKGALEKGTRRVFD